MNFLLNTDLNNMKLSDAPSEILGLGGQVVIIGILTVFAVLCLLWACLALLKVIFNDMLSNKPKKVSTENEVVESFVAPAPAAADDDEIIAVIAAAIAAAESESGSAAKFRVVSFRRI